MRVRTLVLISLGGINYYEHHRCASCSRFLLRGWQVSLRATCCQQCTSSEAAQLQPLAHRLRRSLTMATYDGCPSAHYRPAPAHRLVPQHPGERARHDANLSVGPDRRLHIRSAEREAVPRVLSQPALQPPPSPRRCGRRVRRLQHAQAEEVFEAVQAHVAGVRERHAKRPF